MRPKIRIANFFPSVVALVLLVPQGIMEVEDALIESAVPRRDAHIGTG